MSALRYTTRRGPDGAQSTVLRPVGGSRAGTRPDVEIVVPLYNEQAPSKFRFFLSFLSA
jgi:hypothetical protein